MVVCLVGWLLLLARWFTIRSSSSSYAVCPSNHNIRSSSIAFPCFVILLKLSLLLEDDDYNASFLVVSGFSIEKFPTSSKVVPQKKQQPNTNNNNHHHLTDQERRLSFTLKKRNPYDVHVYYNTDNGSDSNAQEEKERAMDLRSKMRQEFPWMNFYDPKDQPVGPHPFPMWEADFGHYENRHQWDQVRIFLEKETRGTLSVLIHPHSTDSDYDDHTKNAHWIGKPLQLPLQGWRR